MVSKQIQVAKQRLVVLRNLFYISQVAVSNLGEDISAPDLAFLLPL
jgi:hypothetical protein